jgi:hypothetical protein
MKKLVCGLVFLVILHTVCAIADECMEGDCEDGVGVGFTDDGKIYQGEWQEGMPHGLGKLQISKGKYVEGIWEMGKLIDEKTKVQRLKQPGKLNNI